MHCRTARQKGAAGGRVLRVFPKSRWKGAEAVNPERSGRAPRSNGLRPGFPNWMKSGSSSSSSSSSRRKRTRRTGGKEARTGKPTRSSHPNQRGPGRREVGGRAVGTQEEVPGRRQKWRRGGRAPAKCAEPGGTGEVKRGVGEPDSQMGKSYANSALPRANQCSASALPRDWLAREGGGARATRNPGPPHSSTRSLVYTRASLPRTPLPSPRSAPSQKSERVCAHG